MSAAAVLKKVRNAYPDAFTGLPGPKLKLVEKAVIYASQVGEDQGYLSSEEFSALMMAELGKTELTPGDFLRAYRNREDLTQATLAKRTRIPQANLSAMESGKRPIGVKTAKMLAKILGCRYQRLL
jgi:DNA-binding XRE family transcriptional regulator